MPRKRWSLTKQITEAFDAITRIGQSRHQAKQRNIAHQFIFSHRTRTTYQGRCITAVRWIRDQRPPDQPLRQLREITPAEWRAYINHCDARGLSGSGTRSTIAALRKLEQALRERQWWTGEEPFIPTDLAAAEPRSLPRFGFDQDMAAAIIDELDGSSQLAARIAVTTGLRVNEIARLRVADVDFEQKTITVRSASAKGGRSRVVDRILDPSVLDAIPRHQNFVFPGAGSTVAKQFQRDVAAARDRVLHQQPTATTASATAGAGGSSGQRKVPRWNSRRSKVAPDPVPTTPGMNMHAFRGTYAEQLLRHLVFTEGWREVDARRELAAQLGHGRTNVTFRYCPALT